MEPDCIKEERRYALLPIIMPEARALTVKDACAVLHVGRTTMSRLLNTGKIRGFRMPNEETGHWRITEAELKRYIDARMEASV